MLAIAAFLDYQIGDPWNWLHPVQVMGWVISQYTRLVLKVLHCPAGRRVAGVLLGLGLIVGSGGVGWGVVAIATRAHPLLGLAIESITLASCFAGRSLRWAAEDVLQALATADLATARTRLSRYVGRDTDTLSEPEILRAVLETVTENATDGVLAPLFYTIVGAAFGLGSVPLAMAYKAASTLDSMVGYREAPYTDLGWFSAKVEDGLTWVPCRLVVATLSVLSGRPRHIWKRCLRDAPQDASPNSGWSECAYAAALDVQVGGINTYRGVVKAKPLLGDAVRPITAERVEQALRLTRACFLVWLSGAIGAMVLRG